MPWGEVSRCVMDRPLPIWHPASVDRAIGIVVIGRNEGERLLRCLASVAGAGRAIVYVDSGSTDGSLEAARARGVEVVELDQAVPFTAARARNAGFARLLERAPATTHVQFVDGDCEVQISWLDTAASALDANPDVAAVCGRRRERHPEASPYNRLCDMEWDTPVGEADACGGDAMMRVSMFQAVSGFDPTLIAGEEPELCVRFRGLGLRILRLDAEMTLHDAALTRFGQWWKRSVRAGHAAIEVYLRHPDAYGHGGRIARSAVFFGLGLPVAFLVLSGAGLLLHMEPLLWAAALIPLLYLVLLIRIVWRRRRPSETTAQRLLYGVACVVGKWAELQGVLKYLRDRRARRTSTLIEYK